MIGRILALIIKLMVDKRVPWRLKIIPIAGIVYVLSPWDFLPDLIPLLGWIDDIFILIGSLLLFLGLSPAAILRNISGQKDNQDNPGYDKDNTIDGDFRIVDDESEKQEE